MIFQKHDLPISQLRAMRRLFDLRRETDLKIEACACESREPNRRNDG